jgi:hypothetical protein
MEYRPCHYGSGKKCRVDADRLACLDAKEHQQTEQQRLGKTIFAAKRAPNINSWRIRSGLIHSDKWKILQ